MMIEIIAIYLKCIINVFTFKKTFNSQIMAGNKNVVNYID